MFRYWLLTLAALFMLAGTAHAQTPTVAGSPVPGNPAGWRVLARGKCNIDPSASLADGVDVDISCAAPGAMVGSLVVYNVQSMTDLTAVFIKRAGVTVDNRVDFLFGSYGATQNPGTLSIVFAVIQ
jgi:hypothetical protein